VDDGLGSTNYPPFSGGKAQGKKEWTRIIRNVHQKEISTSETKEKSKEKK